MHESVVTLFKLSWPPVATFVGGTVATTTLELSPEVIYPILTALAVAIWRFATFVKGVQDAIKEADKDRKEMAGVISEIYDKINDHGRGLAVIESGCPVAQKRRATCNPFPDQQE